MKKQHIEAINELAKELHKISDSAGWWVDFKTKDSKISTLAPPIKLCLTHSELSEAMEGFRKDLMDDKLPHRKMAEVELADAVIRILDLAGAYGFDVGGAMSEKIAFNKNREDHKVKNRSKENGKKY